MSNEIKKSAFHKSYKITVHPNETNKNGKYKAYGRNFWGQTDPPEAAINLPTYNEFGDSPDELIEKIKNRIDQDRQ